MADFPFRPYSMMVISVVKAALQLRAVSFGLLRPLFFSPSMTSSAAELAPTRSEAVGRQLNEKDQKYLITGAEMSCRKYRSDDGRADPHSGSVSRLFGGSNLIPIKVEQKIKRRPDSFCSHDNWIRRVSLRFPCQRRPTDDTKAHE